MIFLKIIVQDNCYNLWKDNFQILRICLLLYVYLKRKIILSIYFYNDYIDCDIIIFVNR